jgi:hypothetical protein
MTLFGTLALVLADTTTEPDPTDCSREMRETRQDIEGEDIRKAA